MLRSQACGTSPNFTRFLVWTCIDYRHDALYMFCIQHHCWSLKSFSYWTEDVAYLIECLFSLHKALGSFPSTCNTVVVTQVCNGSTEIPSGEWEVQGHCQLHDKLEAAWNIWDPVSKEKEKDNNNNKNSIITLFLSVVICHRYLDYSFFEGA